MNKSLNIITIVLGSIQVLAGLSKLLNMGNLTLSIGAMNMNVPVNKGMLYIVFINLLCGTAMIVHSWLTMKFKKKLTLGTDPPNYQNLSLLGRLTGIITLISSSWLVIENFATLSGFEGKITQFWPLLVLYLIVFLPFPIIPLILVSKNLSLNNEISQNIDSIEKIKRIQEARNRKR